MTDLSGSFVAAAAAEICTVGDIVNTARVPAVTIVGDP